MNIFVSLGNRFYNYIFRNINDNNIDLILLYSNSSAIQIIEKNYYNVNWDRFSSLNISSKFIFACDFPYYNYKEIKENNKVINNKIIEEFAKRIYKPDKFINLESDDLEKEMDEYISIYE
jgi:hypothetical protein